jgi:hypothetical protein
VKRFAGLIAIALLVGCSSEETTTEGAAHDVAAQPGDSPAVTPPATLVEIPAAFLGYWDYTEGQCAVWSDAQLTIEPRRLQFYESTGQVTAVRQPDATTIIVSMAMSGEGDTWAEEATYRLLNGGQVLESSFDGPDAGEPFRRKRCEVLADLPME